MSKAEDRAMQYCCTKCANNKLNCGMKLISHGRNCIECSNYIEGYHQAEKDLELTWEDIKVIEKLLGFDNIIESPKEFYQEVLKRFKKMKED